MSANIGNIAAALRFQLLPDDALGLILSSLTWRELLNAQLAYSSPGELISESHSDQLWKPHFERYFPEGNRYYLPKQDGESYKALFARSYNRLLACLTRSGYALRFASAAFKNDGVTVLAAVTKDGHALKHASETLKNDGATVLAAATQDSFALQFASEALKNDGALVLCVVTQYGYALQFASAALKNNEVIILAAVNQNGRALNSASPTLRNNPELQRISRIKNNVVRTNACRKLFDRYRAEQEPAPAYSAAAAGMFSGLRVAPPNTDDTPPPSLITTATQAS